ncbi:MAG: nickel-dependent lactate racemase [Candidatus Aerophobetes bacterium]|nr:nickel-dependent lactate racemase [Candidatus Aerophobetes bacterium]
MNTSSWKKLDLEYGKNFLQIKVPPWCDILKMGYSPALKNPAQQIENALSNPIENPTIEDIITSHKKSSSKISVAIAVSDNTRPVPYSGEKEEGILLPLLKRLKKVGVKDKNIRIIVGTGTHLPTSNEWKKEAFGKFIKDKYEIIDHSCTSSDLCYLAHIDGVPVKINRQFLEADIHIATGLVEPHFMAGVSGGRKAICPGLVNLETTYLFHGVNFMDNPNATNLILKDNPCHNFALKVAQKARVDFSVNVVLNGEMRLAAVFAGDLEKAHLEAVEKVKGYSLIPVEYEYDIVLTQGGSVAVNHYQAAKAAYGTLPIIKRGGIVILVAHNSDKEPIGKDDYKKVMKILKEREPGKFTQFIKSKRWQFVPDQWQAQKWDQFFRKVGAFDGLIYCTININPEDLRKLPGKSGYDFVEKKKVKIDKMVQNAIFYAVDKMRQEVKEPKMAFVKEGPYAVIVN